MPFYRIIRLSFLFFLWFQIASSQNFPSKNYTAAGELPNNSVRSLLVDSNNILWIGTENGVVKKENDVFTYFFEEDGLALNSCWAIAEDSNKNIWFGSYGNGVSIYDGNKFKVISEENGLVHNEVTRLFSYKDHMFVGTSDGISIINLQNFKVKSLNIPSSKELFRVQDFFEYEQEIYVVTYNSGIFRIDFNNDQPVLAKVNNHQYIYSVLKDNDSIYSSNKGFYTKNKLTGYLDNSESFATKKNGRSIIWDYVKTKDKKIYAAAWGIFDTDGGIYEVTNQGFISKASEFNISSTDVISLAYDSIFEKLYVGTKDAGLFEIKLKPLIKFRKIEGQNIIGFARTGKTSAVLSTENLVITNGNDINSISLIQFKKWQQRARSNKRTLLPKDKDSFYELNHSLKAEEINFYDVKAERDHYWINSNIGIFAIDETGELKHYLPIHSEEINFTEAGELMETHPYGGLRIFNDLDTFQYSYYDAVEAHTPTMIVNSLKKEDKTYLLSVFSGLYIHDKDGFSSYVENGTWKEKQLRHISSLGKNLAISSEFGDVYIVNDQASFKILNKIPRAHIHGNTISFLKEYQGTLLIGTEKGLTLFKNGRNIFLDEEQGLKQPFLSAEVNKDLLIIGSTNGTYSIDLQAVGAPESLVNELKVKEIFINNDKLASRNLLDQNKIDLAYDQNTVLLKFSTNAHPYPHKLSYQYRLKPDENWSLPSSRPEIFLPFLPANKYNVAVKVSDQSTGLSYSEKLISLRIRPPFWRTWWFAVLLIIIVITLVYGIYKHQIRQSQNFEAQKRMIQQRFEETKMEALLAQMNPHFIFNAMNSIQNYIMDSDIDNASLFLGDFAKLIRLNLDHCTKPTILLIEEIEYLQAYIRVENTRFENRIQVVMDVDPTIDTYDIEIPTMLLQTFVENVFVHAFPVTINDPSLKISFQLLADSLLQCKIEDNGIGFSKGSTNKLHQSKGVKLVKERLALMGYDVEEALKIISTKDKGTTVTITLKV